MVIQFFFWINMHRSIIDIMDRSTIDMIYTINRYNGILKVRYFKRRRDSWLNIKKLWINIKRLWFDSFWFDMNRSIIDIIDTMEY